MGILDFKHTHLPLYLYRLGSECLKEQRHWLPYQNMDYQIFKEWMCVLFWRYANDIWMQIIMYRIMYIFYVLMNCKWMNGVTGHESALLRLYWAGDKMCEYYKFCYEPCPWRRIDRSTCWPAAVPRIPPLWTTMIPIKIHQSIFIWGLPPCCLSRDQSCPDNAP